MKPLPPDDLAYVATKAERAFGALRPGIVMVTGATGFVGSWLCETAPFRTYQHSRSLRGDIRNLIISEGVTHIIHCASAATGAENEHRTAEVCDMIARGTARVADECARVGAKLLVVSSSSVYAATHSTEPREAWGVDERAPLVSSGESVAAQIAQAKRHAEEYALNCHENTVIARCFGLMGPRLPAHLIAAQLMAHTREKYGVPFLIHDPGRTRSWLYAADAAAWLWHLLAFGVPGEAYNVGSPYAGTLRALASHCARRERAFHFGASTPDPAPLLPVLRKMQNLAGELWCETIPPGYAVDRWYAWEVA